MYQLIEYIQVYDDVLGSDDLDLILSESKASSDWQEARIAVKNEPHSGAENHELEETNLKTYSP